MTTEHPSSHKEPDLNKVTSEEKGDSIDPMKVIIGRDYYDGHKDKWRAGLVIPESLDASRGFAGGIFVNVVCQPRGKERKARTIQCVATSLLKDTPVMRAKLLAAGFDPDQPNGRAVGS